MPWMSFPCTKRLLFHPCLSKRTRMELLVEPVARVAVVIDAVLLLQFLDVMEGRLSVRPDAFVRMQQHLLQATAHAHVFVLRQVLEQSGKPLLHRTGTSTRSILICGP